MFNDVQRHPLRLEIYPRRLHHFASRRYRAFVASGKIGYATDFVVDAVALPSPYAFSFGGFVNLNTSLWLGAPSIFSSAVETSQKRKTNAPGDGTQLLRT